MKKLGILFITLIAFMFMAISAQAQTHALSNTAAGDTITVDVSSVAGADALVFNPSPKVWMTGATSAQGFAVNAVHQQALETTGGKAYGMAADTNKLYFISVAAAGSTITTVGTSDSTEFRNGTNGYSEMQ